MVILTLMQRRSQAARRAAATRRRQALANPGRLTRKQQRVLNYLTAYVDRHGHAPRCEEARAALGYSAHSSVVRFMNVLEAAGHFVCARPQHPRALNCYRAVNATVMSRSHETFAIAGLLSVAA